EDDVSAELAHGHRGTDPPLRVLRRKLRRFRRGGARQEQQAEEWRGHPILLNMNVATGAATLLTARGGLAISLIGSRGLVSMSGDRKSRPESVPASQGRSGTTRSLTQWPSSTRLIESPPTNQSGLGATM